MKTLGDLHKFISSAHRDMELFGCTKELEDGFRERCKVIGPAIGQERGITYAEVSKLPPETMLGENSGPLAESLKNWFSLEAAFKK